MKLNLKSKVIMKLYIKSIAYMKLYIKYINDINTNLL